MALYREVANDFSEKVGTSEFFRLEGYISLGRLDSTNKEGYIYLSSTQNHHMYFSIKRIKQLIEQTMRTRYDMDLNHRTLADLYPQIKKLISQNNISDSLYSTRILCTEELGKLISENSISPRKKENNRRCIEHSDVARYGGGYGLADEWRILFGYLTYFTATTRITKEDIIKILAEMKKTGKFTSKEYFAQIVSEFSRYEYRLGENVFDNYGKYNIMDAMERIMEKGLFMPGSDLANNPSAIIKQVVADYEKGRKVLMKSLEQQEKIRNMTR